MGYRYDSVDDLMSNCSSDVRNRNIKGNKKVNLKLTNKSIDIVKSKYGSKKVEVDGIIFDSKREAQYYGELKTMEMCGLIKSFERQVDFVLQEGFEKDGKKVRPIKIRVDFVVTLPDGTIEVRDPKGFKTKEYIIKKKMFDLKYRDIRFVEI